MCSWPHPYSALILGVFPLHQIAHVGRQRAHGLFGREIIFEEFQPMWKSYLNVTDRQTDRRLTVASRRSALASRGKNSRDKVKNLVVRGESEKMKERKWKKTGEDEIHVVYAARINTLIISELNKCIDLKYHIKHLLQKWHILIF